MVAIARCRFDWADRESKVASLLGSNVEASITDGFATSISHAVRQSAAPAAIAVREIVRYGLVVMRVIPVRTGR
jgi:hypothetical protein